MEDIEEKLKIYLSSDYTEDEIYDQIANCTIEEINDTSFAVYWKCNGDRLGYYVKEVLKLNSNNYLFSDEDLIGNLYYIINNEFVLLNKEKDNMEIKDLYLNISDKCRKLFAAKLSDYGTSWRVLRNSSVVDQIFIKLILNITNELKGLEKESDVKVFFTSSLLFTKIFLNLSCCGIVFYF